MFRAHQVEIHVVECVVDELIVEIITPAGTIELVGQIRIADGVLYFTAHMFKDCFMGH